jgi:hypothetical protein
VVPNLYKLSDADLKQRAEDGDLEADGALHDRIVVRGLVANAPNYIQLWTWIAPRFLLHFKKDDSGRVRIYLQLDDSISIGELEVHKSSIVWWQKFLRQLQGCESNAGSSGPGERSAFPPPWLQLRIDNARRRRIYLDATERIDIAEIKYYWANIRLWQKFLREEQGAEPYTVDGYLDSLNRLHENGKSYSEIARGIDERAIYWVDRYCERMAGCLDEESLKGDEWSEVKAKHWEEECSAALFGFNVLGCSGEEMRAWLKQALAHAVLRRDAPRACVDRQLIIDAIRKFRNRGKKGLGVRKIKKT